VVATKAEQKPDREEGRNLCQTGRRPLSNTPSLTVGLLLLSYLLIPVL